MLPKRRWLMNSPWMGNVVLGWFPRLVPRKGHCLSCRYLKMLCRFGGWTEVAAELHTQVKHPSRCSRSSTEA